jgi:acyl-CoA dehydrogenase
VDFEFSASTRNYLQRLGAFMDEHIYPNEERFCAELSEGDRWEEPALLAQLRHKAQAAGCGTCSCPTRTTAPD